MSTLAIAYFVAWIAVSAYVGRMGVIHRQLSRRMDRIELQRSAPPRTRAA